MTPRELKAEFILRGKTQKSVAEKLGVTPQYVALVVGGKRKAPHIRKAIAKELGIPFDEIRPR